MAALQTEPHPRSVPRRPPVRPRPAVHNRMQRPVESGGANLGPSARARVGCLAAAGVPAAGAGRPPPGKWVHRMAPVFPSPRLASPRLPSPQAPPPHSPRPFDQRYGAGWAGSPEREPASRPPMGGRSPPPAGLPSRGGAWADAPRGRRAGFAAAKRVLPVSSQSSICRRISFSSSASREGGGRRHPAGGAASHPAPPRGMRKAAEDMLRAWVAGGRDAPQRLWSSARGRNSTRRSAGEQRAERGGAGAGDPRGGGGLTRLTRAAAPAACPPACLSLFSDHFFNL